MERKQIDLVKLCAKAKSKYELYQLLTSHCNLYYPPYKYCTVDFCADVLDGVKLTLECDKVTVKKIPQVKGFRTEDLETHSTCYGLSELINHILQSRQSTILNEKNLTMSIPARILDAIESSNYISTSRGRSNLLLNRTKRFQRIEKESAIIDEREKDKRAIMALENEIASPEEELKYQHDENKDSEKNRTILKKLFDDNVIDGEGNLL